MINRLGKRIRMRRTARGWTQEDLATQADVDRRTIQRVEEVEGYEPSAETMRGLARAFGVEIGQLRIGFSEAELAEFEAGSLCPTCGALLESRVPIENEYGDEEFEIFRCGYTRGWRERPCPQDPRFPQFDDYELEFIEEANGTWYCSATGRTDMARAVDLGQGVGASKEQAERMVRWFYVHAKEGYEAAEAKYPLFR
jgi:transcriptional regulator with XRE-family HTH domain